MMQISAFRAEVPLNLQDVVRPVVKSGLYTTPTPVFVVKSESALSSGVESKLNRIDCAVASPVPKNRISPRKMSRRRVNKAVIRHQIRETGQSDYNHADKVRSFVDAG